MKASPQQMPMTVGSPRPIPPALVEAIRLELKALVEGDLDTNLTQIERVTVRARELFMAMKGPAAPVQRGRIYGGPALDSMSDYGVMSSGGGGMTVGPYPNTEQFGAKAIRELISLIPEVLNARSNSPEQLMAAISLAKKEGHTEIAEALTRRLLGPASTPVDTAEKKRPAHDAHEEHVTHVTDESIQSVHGESDPANSSSGGSPNATNFDTQHAPPPVDHDHSNGSSNGNILVNECSHDADESGGMST